MDRMALLVLLLCGVVAYLFATRLRPRSPQPPVAPAAPASQRILRVDLADRGTDDDR